VTSRAGAGFQCLVGLPSHDVSGGAFAARLAVGAEADEVGLIAMLAREFVQVAADDHSLTLEGMRAMI
jgi:hypothetical protein